MVIECSRRSKYYVFGEGRWREVDSAEGSVSGWGRVRFVVARRGKLHVVRRGRILAALRALAAGRRSALRLGPSLPNKRVPTNARRRKSRTLSHSSTQTGPVKHCHCCLHVEHNRCSLMQEAPGLSMPIIETEPLPVQAPRGSLTDACVQTSLTPIAVAPTGAVPTGPFLKFEPDRLRSSSSTSETLAGIKLAQNKRGVKRKLSSSGDTSQDTAEYVSQSILKREYNKRFLRSKKTPKVERRMLRSSTVHKISSDSDVPLAKASNKSDADVPSVKVADKSKTQKLNKTEKKSSGEMCRELMISELDVAILRRYLVQCYTGFDRRRYDHDPAYKAGFFYAINPLVIVERYTEIDRMLERQEQTSVERFASRLGLRRSVSQISSPRLRSASASNRHSVDRETSSQLRPITRQSLRPPDRSVSALRPTSTPIRHSPRVGPATATVTIPTSTDSDSDTDKENFDTSSRRRVTRGPIVSPNIKMNDVTTTRSRSRQNVQTTSVQSNGSMDTSTSDESSDGSNKISNDKIDSSASKNKNNNNSLKNNNNIDASKPSSTKNNESKNKNNSKTSKKENNVNRNEESKKESNSKTNSDRSKNIKNNSKVSEKESNNLTNTNPSTTGTEKQARVELDRIEILSGNEQNVSDKNAKKNVQNNNDRVNVNNNKVGVNNNKAVVNNNKDSVNNNKDVIDRQLREKIKELDKKSNSVSKEYSAIEDHAIVAWISSGNRASLVNGNRIWQELEPAFASLAGRPRSWHSLRNRYLRHLLPTLGIMALPPKQQQQLRAAAAKGEIKKRFEERRNSIFGKADRGASSRPRPATASSPPPSPPKTRHSLLSPRPNGAPPPPPSPPPSPPRTRKSLRYSEVTRQFAARHRTPSPSTSASSPPRGPSPRTPSAGTTRSGRRLYNPNTAL